MQEVIAEGKHLRLVSDNGWEFVERKNTSGVVFIAPVTQNREIGSARFGRHQLGW